MAIESQLRTIGWLRTGCNSFDNEKQISKPMSFWTEQDVLQYLKQFNIPYASIYGDIVEDIKGNLKMTGCSRTGCVFCGFGCHLEKEPNRFQKLKQTHPKLHEYCMKSIEDGGLGMKDVLDYISVKYD
jgi:3'-phosphoadenosine 5'-phosphosulfate sulfotransferase (PAPS reductase)/FAD synthetase